MYEKQTKSGNSCMKETAPPWKVDSTVMGQQEKNRKNVIQDSARGRVREDN